MRRAGGKKGGVVEGAVVCGFVCVNVCECVHVCACVCVCGGVVGIPYADRSLAHLREVMSSFNTGWTVMGVSRPRVTNAFQPSRTQRLHDLPVAPAQIWEELRPFLPLTEQPQHSMPWRCCASESFEWGPSRVPALLVVPTVAPSSCVISTSGIGGQHNGAQHAA